MAFGLISFVFPYENGIAFSFPKKVQNNSMKRIELDSTRFWNYMLMGLPRVTMNLNMSARKYSCA